MSKYIIEIFDEPYTNGMDGPKLYRAKNFSSLVFDSFGLSRLKKLDTTQEEAYEKGIADAWALARRITRTPSAGGLSVTALKTIFGNYCYEYIFNGDPNEAMQKIAEYDSKEKALDEELVKTLKEMMDRTDYNHFQKLLAAAMQEKQDEQI